MTSNDLILPKKPTFQENHAVHHPRVSIITEIDDELMNSDSNSTENLRILSHRFFEPVQVRNNSSRSASVEIFQSEPRRRRRKPVIMKWKSNDDLLMDRQNLNLKLFDDTQ